MSTKSTVAGVGRAACRTYCVPAEVIAGQARPLHLAVYARGRIIWQWLPFGVVGSSRQARQGSLFLQRRSVQSELVASQTAPSAVAAPAYQQHQQTTAPSVSLFFWSSCPCACATWTPNDLRPLRFTIKDKVYTSYRPIFCCRRRIPSHRAATARSSSSSSSLHTSSRALDNHISTRDGSRFRASSILAIDLPRSLATRAPSELLQPREGR